MNTEQLEVKKGRGRPKGSKNISVAIISDTPRDSTKLCIKENDKGLLWEITHESGIKTYETWLKRLWSFGSKKGQLIEPDDENFGICAWIHYGIEQAEKAFHEITTGERTIKQMIEANED